MRSWQACRRTTTQLFPDRLVTGATPCQTAQRRVVASLQGIPGFREQRGEDGPADGPIPASLRDEKDWDCFQRALAGSDLVVLGHRSHELVQRLADFARRSRA